MFKLAISQLKFDYRRSILTASGIAAVLATMLVLQGFRDGLDRQLRDVAMDRGADLIVTQTGIRNIVGARSVIPQQSRARVESVEGVRAAHPMTALPLIFEQGGRKSPIFLTITDSVGGPDPILRGRGTASEGEVVVDGALARMYGLSLGDDLELVGHPFRIVGITKPTAVLWTPFVFSNYDALIEFYFESDLGADLSAFPLVSLLLVRLEPGARVEMVRQAIEVVDPEIDVFTPAELAANDAALGRTMLGAVLEVLIGVAYATGLLVLGLFMFTTVEGRRRDLGVLKAIGFPNRTLVVSIVCETAILVVFAVPLGLGLASLVAGAINTAVPLYRVIPTLPVPVLHAVAACGLFTLAGAVAPLRFIGRLEPGEVFRA